MYPSFRIPNELKDIVHKWRPEYAKECFSLEMCYTYPNIRIKAKFKEWVLFEDITHRTWFDESTLERTLNVIDTKLEEELDYQWYYVWKSCESGK